MPYDWIQPDPRGTSRELHLWPHRSLPRRGAAAFILVTFALLTLPLFTVLGSAITMLTGTVVSVALPAIAADLGAVVVGGDRIALENVTTLAGQSDYGETPPGLAALDGFQQKVPTTGLDQSARGAHGRVAVGHDLAPDQCGLAGCKSCGGLIGIVQGLGSSRFR